MVYKSIRPGANRPHEPVVNDLRVLEYDGATGFVNFKINFHEELQPLPGRPHTKLIREKPFNFKPKRTSLLQLPCDQWQDLQDLKPLMPPDCHHYDDNLPFNSESLRQKKKAEKRAAQQPGVGDNKSKRGFDSLKKDKEMRRNKTTRMLNDERKTYSYRVNCEIQSVEYLEKMVKELEEECGRKSCDTTTPEFEIGYKRVFLEKKKADLKRRREELKFKMMMRSWTAMQPC
ncbi:hypothetical protein GE061_007313 [Apolygus lucorum]|uniref:Uncharacterized protein n=1 Tax=Apolygus lucorum TaxID=248454 RepID=A0A8S9WRK4_APOLU|nr:hypothetical protein GE061_007313 [Apolygus lucorum]